MKDRFLSNNNDLFLNRIKDNLKKCSSFNFSVSFIKKAGLVLFEKDIEEALERGATGKIITSTYQNFTDVESLEKFLLWQNKYPNFECRLEYECFGDKGFHTKGYFFEYDEEFELIIGSSNITRYALKNNFEWDISLLSKEKVDSYNDALIEFNLIWENTLKLDQSLIEKYKLQLEYAIEKWDMDYVDFSNNSVNPNSMQRKALRELRRYRDSGVKKALIISATGSGKTYLAAFDARNFGAKRLLYIVHRESILKDARDSFLKVFGAERTYGFFTGNEKSLEADFVFATSNMLSRHLDQLDKNEFDYIIYDEVHHIVAETGKKIFEFFNPDFILGLTATPERMDNGDVFGMFDQNVPFELRLRDAINNDLVVPFHYYGIRDKLVDYSPKDKMVIANAIASQHNIEFIKEQIEKHRKPGEKLKCIAFCTDTYSSKLMAEELYEEGYHTISLTGKNDTGVRIKAFKDLQDDNNLLEIICTVDILNEGVDIPQINMVLFLRPTESQTIFIQQLGRGLRKYPGKEYVTVLDFIGNNYDRAVQIAMALGTLSKTTYMEKAYLKEMIRTNFKSLDIPEVLINIDDLSKEEIINYIDKTNFNSRVFLEKDYKNFKAYINNGSYPSHLDFLNSDVAPDFIRIIKSDISGKNKSYYNFLRKIKEENLPLFNDDEVDLINNIEDLLPIARLDEYLIIQQLIDDKKLDLKRIEGKNKHITDSSLKNAYENLKKLTIVENNKINLSDINNEYLINYIHDVLNYGIIRYEREFGEFDGLFKLYRNYYTEQASRILLINGNWQRGTYYSDDITYIFAGLKKDLKDGRLNYKDKFISDSVFQWESVADIKDNEIDNLDNSKKVQLFIRKMKTEDGVTLPYTYFGLGILTNKRSSYTQGDDGREHRTVLYDIVLENKVPEYYHVDFEIPNNN